MVQSVSELWRYPVKSCGGEQLQSADVGPLGIRGDRRWGIRDNATGKILTGRRAAPLLMASARLVDDEPGVVLLSLPNGAEVSSAYAGVDIALTRWLGKNVSLVLADEEEGGTFENPMNAELESDWMSWTGPSGAFHDSGRSRVSMVGHATMGDWDQRRFRANIILDGGEAGAEDALVGSAVSVGEAQLDVTKQIDRCVMVTRPQPGIGRDLSVLKTINAERATFLSVGALVSSAGKVSVGDELEVLAAPSVQSP